MQISMAKEARLCVFLIVHGEKVPPAIKQRAVESLRVESMNLEEGDADAFLLDKLASLIESEDKQGLFDFGDLLAEVLGTGDEDDDGGDSSLLPTEAVKRRIDDTIRGFCDEDKARLKALEKLNETFMFMPLEWHEPLLIGLSQKHSILMVLAVNRRDLCPTDIANLLEETDQASLIKDIHEQWGKSDFEFKFFHLTVNVLADGIAELRLEPADDIV